VVFITTTVLNWLPVFNNDKAAKTVLMTLKDNLEHYQCCLLGYVLMPSHIHCILCMSDMANLSRFMQTFKILSSKRIKALELPGFHKKLRYKNDFRLWKPRYDDLVINSEKQFLIKLKYIHLNPVRAGLVQRVKDWKYSSAGDWLVGKPGIIPVEINYEWKY